MQGDRGGCRGTGEGAGRQVGVQGDRGGCRGTDAGAGRQVWVQGDRFGCRETGAGAGRQMPVQGDRGGYKETGAGAGRWRGSPQKEKGVHSFPVTQGFRPERKWCLGHRHVSQRQ